MYHAMIMAGGSGTRLWPLSREKYPKQALKLIGERTMFQHAVDRLSPLFSPDRIHVVSSAVHRDILLKQAPEIPAGNFIVEPDGRGTAPAIGLAAVILQHKDPSAVMAVLTADHYIADTDRFRIVLSAARAVAQGGHLVTLGVQPTEPATGFGYIQQGELIGDVEGQAVYHVQRFIEKPKVEQAVQMMDSGQFSWNSGMFIWQISQLMLEFERQMPDLFAQLMDIKASIGKPDFTDRLDIAWQGVRKATLDYGIMEGAKDVAVIPVSMGWSDIGSWGSLLEILPHDLHENILVGESLVEDSCRNLIFGADRLVAALGVEDLIIVDTPDALLVCKRGSEQDVKKLVQLLKENGKENLV